jgi:hypothetical protein
VGDLEKEGKNEVCFKRAESRRSMAHSAAAKHKKRPSGQGEIPDRRYGVLRDDGRQARELRSLARGRSGVRPEPTVTVRMGEGRTAGAPLERGVLVSSSARPRSVMSAGAAVVQASQPVSEEACIEYQIRVTPPTSS